MEAGRASEERLRRSLTRLFVLGAFPIALLVLDAADRISEQIFNRDILANSLTRILAVAGLIGVLALTAGFYRWSRLRSQIASNEAERTRLRDKDRAHDAAARKRRGQIRAVLKAAETLRVVFQPIIDLSTGRVAGHEALARFDGGETPDEWFARAHAVGLGVELEMLAVTAALDSRPREGYVSINVGPSTLMSKEFFSTLLDDPEPERIVVELTEHAEFTNYTSVQSLLKKIKRLGIRIAIDDAGSGVSSLQHIVLLSPDLIKLDRSLITLIDMDPVRRTLGVALALFAGEIGARLIAEGIERQEERDACAEIGIAFGQGFLFGRPADQPLVDLVGSLDVREAMRTA